jgi:hypothetical protein
MQRLNNVGSGNIKYICPKPCYSILKTEELGRKFSKIFFNFLENSRKFEKFLKNSIDQLVINIADVTNNDDVVKNPPII